jgi:hypothetical protein
MSVHSMSETRRQMTDVRVQPTMLVMRHALLTGWR